VLVATMTANRARAAAGGAYRFEGFGPACRSKLGVCARASGIVYQSHDSCGRGTAVMAAASQIRRASAFSW